jgi:hypothetical protein
MTHTTFSRTALSAALLVTLATAFTAPAEAQRRRDSRVPTRDLPVVRSVHFAIELDDRSVAPFIVSPGERFRIMPGQRLVIRTVATPADRPGDKIYPETRFFIASGGDALRLLDPHPKVGAVDLEASRSARRQVAVIGYEILNDISLEGIDAQGRLEVEIAGSSWSAVSSQTTRELVADLYRGILLREPDRTGASGFEQRIARDGYAGLVSAAQTIAGSEESRKSVYGKGVCDQQRLLAMYKQFLGWSEKQIPVAEWNRGLELFDQQRIPELVTELLRHREFFTSRELEPPSDLVSYRY